MKPWWRRRGKPSQESTQAVQDAGKALEQVRAQRPAVDAVTRALSVHNQRNHYAERIAQLIRGGA